MGFMGSFRLKKNYINDNYRVELPLSREVSREKEVMNPKIAKLSTLVYWKHKLDW